MSSPVVDGELCSGGVCEDGKCALAGVVLPCTEQGIRNAIAAGGGPYSFSCDGSAPVETEAEIPIDKDVVLDGEDRLTVDAGYDPREPWSGNEQRVFSVAPDVIAHLRGLTITGGDAADEEGGGVLNRGTLTLTDSRVLGNTAFEGGGVFNRGSLTLVNSQVSGNAAFEGGGIFNRGSLSVAQSVVSGNQATDGAAIHTDGSTVVRDCNISGNTSLGRFENTLVGAIANHGDVLIETTTVSRNTGYGISTQGRLVMSNSTLSLNGVIFGGGIFASGGTTAISNSTMSGNSFRSVSGGGFKIKNTLIDGACADATVTSMGGNIESPGDTCGIDQETDQVNVNGDDLKLGSLQYNGGANDTHALLPGSVAIDVIPEAACRNAMGEPLRTDQRGESRPAGSMCDAGSFEAQP